MPSVQEIKQLQQIEHEITAAKQQLRALLSNTKKPLSVLAEEQYGKKIEMEPMLTCPIGVTYFTRFLESEMNAENLYCLYEVLSLQDFVAQLQTNTSSALVGEVVKKTHKLLQTYISSGSQQEVNLPAKTKIAIVQVFADAQAKLEQQESNKQTAYLQGILEALHKLKDELLTNLQDPFARYLKSDIFFELASMFMLNRVTVLQARERLMNANKGGEVLNHHGSFDSKTMVPRHPLTVVEDLLNQLIHVFTFRANKLFTSDLQLKYDAYKSSSMCEVNVFKDKVAELAFVDLSLLQSDDEKYAFFTNVHNLMMIHAAMEYEGIPECSYTRVQFLRKVKYTVGGMDLSLDQIAFGILRNNQRHLLFGKRFAATETSKLALIPQSSASLITFGLVDLTSQSPALRIFKPSNFVDQLDQAFVQYLNNRVKFEDSVLYVPSYLKENAKEFAGNNQLQLLTMIQLRMNLEVFSKAIFETNNLATDFTSLFSAEQYKVIRQAVPFVNIVVQKKQSKKNAIKKFVSKISNYAKKALGLQQQQVIAA